MLRNVFGRFPNSLDVQWVHVVVRGIVVLIPFTHTNIRVLEAPSRQIITLDNSPTTSQVAPYGWL